MSKPKRHPADEQFDSPPKGEFLSNAEDLPRVHVDPKTESGQTEDVKPNAGSERIPTFEVPAAPRGVQLPGSDPKETGGLPK